MSTVKRVLSTPTVSSTTTLDSSATSSTRTTISSATTIDTNTTRNSIEGLLRALNAQHPHEEPFALANGKAKGQGTATQVFPRFDKLFPGEPVAIDIEFQQYRKNGGNHFRIGWIAVVNTRGETILDCFAEWEWEAEVVVFNKSFSASFGVTDKAMDTRNGAVKGYVLEQWLKRLLKDRIVIVHGGVNDLKAWFKIDFYAESTGIVDTQEIYGKKGLKDLADQHLDVTIQTGIHPPVEDAVVTMLLYLRRRPYDRSAAYAAFQALPEAEKRAYSKTGPSIMPHCYQDNDVPGAPKPKAITGMSGGRGDSSRGRGNVSRGRGAVRGRGGKKT